VDALVRPVVAPQFDPEELGHETDVVLEEIKQYDDEPASRASQDLSELLFPNHSYGRPVLGIASSVRSHTIARLRNFHARSYTGDRAVLVVAGPVSPRAVFAAARPLLARLPAGQMDGGLRPPRPLHSAQIRIRRADVRETHLALGWQAPPLSDRDAAALEAAAVVLGHGEASRLAREVRRREQAVSDAYATLYVSRAAGSFVVSAHTPGRRTESAFAALLAQIDRLRREAIDEDELRRARAVLRSDVIYRAETVQGIAHAAGYYLSLTGRMDGERRYFEHLDALTPRRVREACDRYLRPEASAVAAVVPRGELRAEDVRRARRSLSAQLRPAKSGRRRNRPRPRTDPSGVQWVDCGNGLRIRGVVDRSVEVTAGWLVWVGGLRMERVASVGAAPLIATLLTRGTAHRDGDSLAREVDGLAASLEGFSARNSLGLQFECLGSDWSALLQRTFECAMLPTFTERELEEERRLALEDLHAEDDDLSAVAFQSALSRLYRGHPFRWRRGGTSRTLTRLRPHHLRGIWERDYPLGRAVLGLCGDFDFDEVVEFVRGVVPEGTAPPKGKAWQEFTPRYPRRAQCVRLYREREQAHVVLAYPGVHLFDRRVYTLEVLNAILGGQAGRLFTVLREEQALVYHVSASAEEGLDAGHVAIYAATSGAKLSRTLSALRQQLDRIVREPPSSEELDLAKASLCGQHELVMQRRGRIAAQLAFQTAYGLGRAEHLLYPQRIARVKKRDVLALAREIFGSGREVCAIVGAGSGRED
jgi:zinc protease